MVGRKSLTGNNPRGVGGRSRGGEILKKSSDKPKSTASGSASASVRSSPSSKLLTRVRSGFVAKKRKVKYADKGIQTLNPDIELVTGTGEPPLKYWKDLAETRRQALEESLTENEILHKRVEDLQQENQELEEMLQDAKQLADMITSITDPDESGIGSEELE